MSLSVDIGILEYTEDELVKYLRDEAGSSSPSYFSSNKFGGLYLQQIPEEYAKLLKWLQKQKFQLYLELGIGDGGSFLLDTMFQPSLKISVAVDNCSYWSEQRGRITEVLHYLEYNKSSCSVRFIEKSTDDFFKDNDLVFDCIFIDADHSYEGVKRDYENSLKILNNNGYIIFHDINSRQCPGVVKLWNEVSSQDDLTFIASGNCGIGVLFPFK